MKLWHLLITILIVGLVAYAVWPFRYAGREPSAISACRANLRQISMANLMYAADYDDRFPDRDRWMDSMMPYSKNRGMLICPSIKKLGNPQLFGYCFNAALSLSQMPEAPAEVPLFFDSVNLAKSASGDIASLPNPPRHRNRSNGQPCNTIAYADGHVHETDGHH